MTPSCSPCSSTSRITRSTPPKSTGKELFHLDYVRERVGGREIATDDLLATLTALSAETVADDLKRLEVADVVAAGGGTRNPTLMAELAHRLPGVPIETFDVFGIPEAGKEALVFAIIGFLTVHRLPATVPSCTGARHAIDARRRRARCLPAAAAGRCPAADAASPSARRSRP